MRPIASPLVIGGNDANLASYQTASYIPTPNRLILLWVYTIAAAAPNAPTATGNGLTWVQVQSQIDANSVRRLTLFRAMGNLPQEGAVTFDFGGQAQTGAAWNIIEYDFVDRSGSNGENAIVQAVASASAGNASSLTVTLGAFESSANATAGGFAFPLNTADLPTAGANFVRTGQRNQAGPNISIGTEFADNPQTSVDMYSATANIPWTGIAVELRAWDEPYLYSSDVHSGFTNNTDPSDTQPFTSGQEVSFTLQESDKLLKGDYTWRVRANDPSGTNTWGAWTNQRLFLAENLSAPTVVTGAAQNISDIKADINGNDVTSDGNSLVTERGVVFSDTNTLPNDGDNKIVAPSAGEGTYNLSVTGLQPTTTYYVRAYAVNGVSTSYGNVLTFATEETASTPAGDGYWTYSSAESNATVGRSQPTAINSSANLLLSDLNLENGQTYTLYFSGMETNNGETKVVLQWYDAALKMQQIITPGTPYTFIYDTAKTDWSIRLFVTVGLVEADNITATFNNMYLAKEATFSGFVPFEANGVTEVKVENNWLVDKQRSEVIQTMFDAMKGVSWYPFEVETEGLGWFEIGDRFTIQDRDSNTRSVVLWNSKLVLDGGIKETLHTEAPDLTETDYNKAGKLGGLWKRTQIEVDKNKMEIQSLVEAVYDFDGVINTKFSEVFQDVDQVRTTVQGSGGVNLIKNSVMYGFDSSNNPDSWTVTGAGSLVIQASKESLTSGAVAGNAFTLQDKTVLQRITVRKDVDFVEEDKTYYALSAKVKKNVVGTAYIKISNRNETLTIDLPDQTSYYWDTVKLEEILPQDDYYDIEIYSDADADLQVTDLIFAPGKTKREWTQANGEVMNASVSITEEGMTIRSPQFANNYTKINAMGFEVHKKDVTGDRIFGFNDDETNVSKLKADKQITMAPMRTVPINYGSYKGWAFTLSEENN